MTEFVYTTPTGKVRVFKNTGDFEIVYDLEPGKDISELRKKDPFFSSGTWLEAERKLNVLNKLINTGGHKNI